MTPSQAVVRDVVAQHAEEASFLWTQRQLALRSGPSSIRSIARLDGRIAAHVDGLRIAGQSGYQVCAEHVSAGEVGGMFAAMALALEGRHSRSVEDLMAVSEVAVEMHRPLVSALGWANAAYLRGTVASLLHSTSDFRRYVGIAACALHRVDARAASTRGFEDPSELVRARALRAAGEQGAHELVSACASLIRDDDAACRFWAAWSAVLLGDRKKALEVLRQAALSGGRFHSHAFSLWLQAADPKTAHVLLQSLARHNGELRTLIRGSGIAGEPAYVPWLISHMTDPRLARVAGESFSLITGADLSLLNLERRRPEDFESGPNDDPEDSNVAMDEDDGLPWPDSDGVADWWEERSAIFKPGVRYFMGEPVNGENCLRVLKDGYQRQRILAAHYLCLLNPGTVLFNTSAPAWRQQRLLAQMG